jgi:hypothetical protein
MIWGWGRPGNGIPKIRWVWSPIDFVPKIFGCQIDGGAELVRKCYWRSISEIATAVKTTRHKDLSY